MEHNNEFGEHLVKVSIRLSEPGYEFETLWAEHTADGNYRLRNVPFLAYGYSEQDTVNVTEIEGRFIVNHVVERSGHSTYRLFLSAPMSEEEFNPLWQPLAALGCTYERANGRLIGIDVPPISDVYEVYSLLERGETSKQWEFEEGHCGHSLRK